MLRTCWPCRSFAPTDHDLAITFVDWNPAPPDKNMGLWRDVYLTTSGPVALRYPTVVSKLNLPTNDGAQLTVTAQVKNGTDTASQGQARRERSRSVSFEQDVELAPNESKDVTFYAGQVPATRILESRVVVAGADGHSESASRSAMQFEVNGGSQRSTRCTEFGIREITSDVNSVGGRAFHINGKNILIRGGGWTPDMMLRETVNAWRTNFATCRTWA